MKPNNLKSPGGMRSYLPELALQLEEIEQKFKEVFDLWGYQPVITPTLEFFESLAVGMGSGLQKELYKFIDYEGNILALRPEMTAPIARTLAGRMEELSFPKRYSYHAPIFRYGQPQSGKNREIYQVGIELIGEQGDLADAEAVILAIEALLNAGVRNFKVDIGHTGFLEGIIDQMGLDREEKDRIKAFLVKRDLVGLRNFVGLLTGEQGEEQSKVLARLPLLRGDSHVLQLAAEMVDNTSSQQAVHNLQQIYTYLSDYGFSDYINFDLSLLRGLDYYTGVVFEGFTEKLGYTICGGGRYDHLIGQYSGTDIPAIGFAIGTERVRLALNKQKYQFAAGKVDAVVVFNHSYSQPALRLVKRLREQGKTVIITECDRCNGDLVDCCRTRGVDRLISFCQTAGTGKVELWDVQTEKHKDVLVEQGWEERLCQE